MLSFLVSNHCDSKVRVGRRCLASSRAATRAEPIEPFTHTSFLPQAMGLMRVCCKIAAHESEGESESERQAQVRSVVPIVQQIWCGK